MVAAPANYVSVALDRFAAYGDREAIVFDDRRLTYRDIRSQVAATAAALRRHGVKPGSAIAVLATNRPATIVLHLAAHLLGCRVALLAGYATAAERVEYLDRAAADVFVYEAPHYEDLARSLLAGRGHHTVLCLGAGGAGPDLTQAPETADVWLDLSDVDGPPSALFYTSGTTGRPKLVHHEHRFYLALLAIAEAWLASGAPALTHLATTGFMHVAGHMTNLLMLFTGSRLVGKNAFDIPDYLATVEREKVTSIAITPVQLYQLLDHPALDDTDMSSVFLVSIGGAPATPARLRQAIERFGPIVRMTYGLSEAAFVSDYRGMTLDPAHPQRLASSGVPFADSRFEVRDGSGGACPPGTTGEVWVTGSLVMSGYWNDPELTREVLVDGWLRTGDVGHVDADGYLYLVDRAKDMIITGAGAVNVYTRPVENALATHPAVRAAAVVGVPDPALGEAVCAFVVTDPGVAVTAEELRDLVSATLSERHAPQTVRFVESLPLTGMGKVDKAALRASVNR